MPLVRHAGSPFWWYDFRFDGRRYRASTGEKGRQAAIEVEALALTRLTQGALPARRKRNAPTLREFSHRFLEWVKNSRNLKPNTRKFYACGWRLLAFSRLASMPIDQITAEIIDCTIFERPLLNRVTRRFTGELVPCSVSYANQALRTLKVMLGRAEEWEVILRRPKFGLPPSPGRDKLIDGAAEMAIERELTTPTSNQLQNRLRYQAWVVFMLLQDTGARPSEIFALRREDIYWAERRIWIAAGKTARARRFVGMTERMHLHLSTWCRGEETPGWLFPARPKRTQKINQTGHLTSIHKCFTAARERAGLDRRIVPYAARHTYATYAVRSTGNIFATSAQMGHADIKSMSPYQHQELDQILDAVNRRNAARESLKAPGHNFGHTTPSIHLISRMKAG